MNLSQDLKQIELTVAKLIARAWTDANFKTRLIDHTSEVLREAGLQIEAVVNTNKAAAPGLQLAANGGYEISLPACPTNISDEQLGSQKGASMFSNICGIDYSPMFSGICYGH